jgi:hypothetical protein
MPEANKRAPHWELYRSIITSQYSRWVPLVVYYIRVDIASTDVEFAQILYYWSCLKKKITNLIHRVF